MLLHIRNVPRTSEYELLELEMILYAGSNEERVSDHESKDHGQVHVEEGVEVVVGDADKEDA